MKVDRVLSYFEQAPLAAAEQLLEIIAFRLKQRKPRTATNSPRRKMSAEGRRKIAEAQKARWASKKAAEEAPAPVRPKRKTEAVPMASD